MVLLKNNRYLFLLLVLGSGILGCTQKLEREVEKPADLIPRDTMVSIFVDLRLMDAVVYFEQRNGNRKIHELKYYTHNSIMEKYGITREQFERSFTYYESDLEVIDQIYADAITQLSMMKSRIDQE